MAFQWNTGFNTDGIHSFANGINTVEGGTHVEGFKAALTTAVNKYARAKNQLKEKDPTWRARTSARASPPSSRCGCATPSSRARPRPSWATRP